MLKLENVFLVFHLDPYNFELLKVQMDFRVNIFTDYKLDSFKICNISAYASYSTYDVHN